MKQNNKFPIVVTNDKFFYIINKENIEEYPKELIELCAPFSDYANKLEMDYNHLEEKRDILADTYNEEVKSYKFKIELLEHKLDALADENKEIKNAKDDILVKYISVRNVVLYNTVFEHFIHNNFIENPDVVSFSLIYDTCNITASFSDKTIVCKDKDIAQEVLKKLCNGEILFVDAIRKYATNRHDFPKIFKSIK